jgi:drug/metabolite transporter (DMT)-like permease
MGTRPELQDKSVFAFLYGGAVILTGIFSLWTTSFSQLSIQPHQWLALLYLGLIASGLSFFLWNLGARKVHEGSLAIMNNMKIPVAIIASVVFLGEQPNLPRLLAGCALIAAALFLNERLSISNRQS